jgi:hypothetical protein
MQFQRGRVFKIYFGLLSTGSPPSIQPACQGDFAPEKIEDFSTAVGMELCREKRLDPPRRQG